MSIFSPGTRFFVGEVLYPPGATLGPRVQSNFQLVYVWEGRATVWIDGRRVGLDEGMGILLFPFRRERFKFSPATATRHGWVDVIGTQLDKPVESALRDMEFQPFPVTADLERLHRMSRAQAGASSEAGTLLHATLAEAMLYNFISTTETVLPGDAAPLGVTTPVRRALQYIRSSFERQINLSDIAGAAGVSSQHLIRLFRQHLDTTPAKRLWEHRCNHAIELVKGTGLSLAEVAAASGFTNAFHLSRKLKERTGMSPREIRSRAWSRDTRQLDPHR